MNRTPLWKYILVIIVMTFAIIYTIPNFFGESPAIQISSNKNNITIDKALENKVNNILKNANISHKGIFTVNQTIKIKFLDTDTQIKALDVINSNLDSKNYIVALNLIPDSPIWLSKINANPLFLGLDLRGGVHFLMEVDMKAAIQKKMDSYTADIRRFLYKEKIRSGGIKQKNDNTLVISFQNAENQNKAFKILTKNIQATLTKEDNNIVLSIPPNIMQEIENGAIEQNTSTLHNRVNALGVAEPIIQQSGKNRIIVQLPGVQDVGKAKDIIGRTAILQVHLVADNLLPSIKTTEDIPDGYELLYENNGTRPILINKQVELTGDDINSAQPGWDQNGGPAVNIEFNSRGSSIFADLTKENTGKRLAMILIDQGKKEVVTAPVIRQAINGGKVEISGSMNTNEAKDIALLLKAGSLSAPMKIIEERTIGPSLGKDNIEKGFKSTIWGYIAVVLFMILYYRIVGIFSIISLTCNLILLISILSLIQATLTLPGIAAIALTLGMAIDSNVLINERMREELRDLHNPPQTSIHNGYEHAWATILDSNITSLIAGVALLLFGYGPVRGFAVVHCIGILTSMFTSVVVSRCLINLWYGSRKNLKYISIGLNKKVFTKFN